MSAFDADLRSLAGQAALSRRTVVVTSLATGFAMAVQPIAAQTAITTDANGLEAGEVRIATQDGEIPAYRAMPATGGPFPTVLVVQEIFGVHEHIKDVCRRLAKLGYFAVAPELYARQGNVATMPDVQQIVREVVSKVPDAQVMADLDAAVAFAKASGKADTARLGITGFCWGGRIVWLYAAHNPGLRAAVAWYGRLAGETTPLMPKNPVDLAPALKAPVLGLYGGADQGIPVSTIEQMKTRCQAAGKTCEFVVYPDAPHAFHADYRPSYRSEPAHDGWRRLQAWFRQHGVA
ncbi:dienelactone hydrolase family protein [Methylobacterium nodulans]|uniref:Dienelactone hydrolase n=1 Tax=Methylobacterium nodulans (strain LMG 21967 / CNCM I-2342 / ORS 2060) TaxID=460265 RepID=B8IT54_METNO|nr:dienelactone hydrolase family protein [Methylobacterium nodulans]ACL56940.1 dienelactone hydrolase [Methylobacterium nodulans ORS 2060]